MQVNSKIWRAYYMENHRRNLLLLLPYTGLSQELGRRRPGLLQVLTELPH